MYSFKGRHSLLKDGDEDEASSEEGSYYEGEDEMQNVIGEVSVC